VTQTGYSQTPQIPIRTIWVYKLVEYDESVVKFYGFIRVIKFKGEIEMKLLKYLFASIALIAGTAQANTISTNVYVNDRPDSATVQYVNFFVNDAGTFDISATGITLDALSDPYIYLFSIPRSAATFIAKDDDISFFNDNALIDNVSLAIGNYVLAVSNYDFSEYEAINGYNGSVNFLNDGWAKVVISSGNGVAQFGTNPSAVPVPAAAWLFGSALLGFAGFRRKSV